ncbi:MAG: arsenate reductase ArsC [Planctomycetales bacterium]|nr:arsenate reductase ArsC [Planctomycetales bacterium]
MKSVLILCTGNSCRSQMAEGLWNHLGGGEWIAQSAGSNPAGYVHDLAKVAMSRVGLSIDNARSKSLTEFVDTNLDLVVTVCDNAKDSCSALPHAAEVLHWPFDDPADATGDESEQLQCFERVRDEISASIREYLNA